MEIGNIFLTLWYQKENKILKQKLRNVKFKQGEI